MSINSLAARPVQAAADPDPNAPDFTVSIKGMAFHLPEGMELKPGMKVAFVNEDGMRHTATSDDSGADGNPLFNLTLGPRQTKVLTITDAMLGENGVAASRGFHCELHPSMQGTLEI